MKKKVKRKKTVLKLTNVSVKDLSFINHTEGTREINLTVVDSNKTNKKHFVNTQKIDKLKISVDILIKA